MSTSPFPSASSESNIASASCLVAYSSPSLSMVASMIEKIGIEIPKPKKRARKKSKGKPKAWTPPKKKVRKKKVAEPAAEGSEQASS